MYCTQQIFCLNTILLVPFYDHYTEQPALAGSPS